MKFFLVYLVSFFSILGGSCKHDREVKTLYGYVVYILPNKVRFVETKRKPDINYEANFESANFESAISFEPNCFIEQKINAIKPDTLFDENPDMKEFATFMKKPLIFPAKLTLYDTSKGREAVREKFKMLFHKKTVEFMHAPFNGVVTELERI